MRRRSVTPGPTGPTDADSDLPIQTPLHTPDGRYIVVRGRLWRASNPGLPDDQRQRLVDALMTARRAVAQAKRGADPQSERAARDRIDQLKVALGERGPPWWSDGAPDFNRRMVRNTPYAGWYAERSD